MTESKLEVPADLRELVETTIDQSEKAFSFFFEAANKSIMSVAAKDALSLTEQNMKAAFEHARKVVRAKDLQQVMSLQTAFLRTQIENTGEYLQRLSGESAPPKSGP